MIINNYTIGEEYIICDDKQNMRTIVIKEDIGSHISGWDYRKNCYIILLKISINYSALALNNDQISELCKFGHIERYRAQKILENVMLQTKHSIYNPITRLTNESYEKIYKILSLPYESNLFKIGDNVSIKGITKEIIGLTLSSSMATLYICSDGTIINNING